ncbi:hypothetical protein PV762_01225 [Mitsuaria sp. CC2]|uniref:hypothetical protein n=1 Tax=Mitsuaria sp. CC2 TaxID=3029186 RepID=UPI003B8C2AAD
MANTLIAQGLLPRKKGSGQTIESMAAITAATHATRRKQPPHFEGLPAHHLAHSQKKHECHTPAWALVFLWWSGDEVLSEARHWQLAPIEFFRWRMWSPTAAISITAKKLELDSNMAGIPVLASG